MNISIDVNATFNPIGDIKPSYVRLEDENHELHTYKIENINYIKNEKYSGLDSMLFNCNICIEECMKDINIRYYVQSHKWSLVN